MKRLTLFVLLFFGLSLLAGAQSTHSVALTWTASDSAAANPSLTYNVYRSAGANGGCTSVSPATKVNTAPVTTTAFTDTVPATIGTYCYAVTSVVNGIESTDSTDAVALVPPDPPTNVTATVH